MLFPVIVLIPFISGLDCYTIRRYARWFAWVLIPFISGLDCYSGQEVKKWTQQRLNPFYFRAGLLPIPQKMSGTGSVLIPFISGLDCYSARAHHALRSIVLIPFISGLDCYSARAHHALRSIVLIPFISGLDCYQERLWKRDDLPGLNPFYFRAGLLPGLVTRYSPRLMS